MINSLFNNKKVATALSVLSNLLLIIMKLITGFVTGSVSIVSEAIHSSSDFIASVIAFYAVHKADEPADNEHQFGHGKYEDAAGFAEGTLIIIAALYIIYEALKKLSGIEAPMNNSVTGIIVMLVSVFVNIFISSYLFKVAKNTNSIAIYSDAEHLKTDVLSSFTVLIGLIIIKYTGLHVIDSLIAITVALIIIYTGYKICRETLNALLDYSLPEKDITDIKTIIKNNKIKGISEIKEIKTRKSGKDKEIVITVTVSAEMTVGLAHSLCDDLENEIEKALGNTKITIHIEPHNANYLSCQKSND